MAASAPPPRQQQQQQKPIEEMMRNLKVEPSAGELADSNTVNLKESSPSDAISCISSAGDATGSVKEGDVDHEALATDQGAALPAAAPAATTTPGYYGYYNPGFDGTYGGMENNQGYYMAAGVDGMELQYPVMQGDNGSLVYFMPGPGVQPGYGPYNHPYLPVAMVGVDGQHFGQQPYSPGPVYQPTLPAYLPYGEMVPSPYFWDPSVFVGDGIYGNAYSGIPEIPGSRPDMSSPNYQHTTPSKNFAPSEINKSLETKSSFPTLDVSSGHGVQNQLKPLGKVLQHAGSFQSDALGKGYFPIAKFPPYDQGKGGIVYPNGPAKANLRSWGNSEKPKPRSKISNTSDFGLLDEQNNGPRTIQAKTLGGNGNGSLPTDGNGNSNSVTSSIRSDHYNLPDFPMEYDRAFFFVIKSYSEDDVHKSIKYNVWSSTSNGNKKLDNAYQDAQMMSEKGSKCPVFLFFSVNASGQFCGVAEMIGRVDFNKNMDFWQQDKWNGFFPVKWHIVKDVPNPQLRHIILENNENKPVTNSRDTQEVKFTQGIEVLNIFKNYVAKTSILDDFEFYESRQKVMQERRRPWISHYDHKQQKGGELTTSFRSVDSEKNSRENQLENKAK